jgi:hypothetical protein
MTGGQPARGTELLTLRWRNSDTCDVRNITIENGLVCFVTSYYKNYSTTNSTKIIYRYLPTEVSEILVYYIWLVIPFLEQLFILNPMSGLEDPASFLWLASIAVIGKLSRTSSLKVKRLAGNLKGFDSRSSEDAGLQKQEEPWYSSQLGEIISEELRRFLKIKASVLLWRHAAIAISRRHLLEGR